MESFLVSFSVVFCLFFFSFLSIKLLKYLVIYLFKFFILVNQLWTMLKKLIWNFFFFIYKTINFNLFLRTIYKFLIFFLSLHILIVFFSLHYFSFFSSDFDTLIMSEDITDLITSVKTLFFNLQFFFFFLSSSIAVLIFYYTEFEIGQIKKFSIYISLIVFLFSLFLLQQYKFYSLDLGYFQYHFVINEIPYFALDGLSLVFFTLTTFLFPLCFLIIYNLTHEIKKLTVSLLLIELLLLAVFSTLDLFSFYIYFELILIPMSLIIVMWGSRSRKIKAMFYFFIYTLFSSLFMLVGIILLFFLLGTTNFYVLQTASILQSKISYFLWPLFFFAFAVKIPMFPFHLWLPEAHVEAPTVGSVLLAGLLLKLGGYGFLRVLLGFFPYATLYFKPIIILFALLGIVYASFTLLRQIDMKKIIAYSSITHMNLAVVGLFSDTFEGILGGLYLLISHGFSSSALFFLIGIVYDRFHSRLIHNYGGVLQLMPKYGFFFFFFTLANFGFPGTANFIAESVIVLNLPEFSFFVFFLCGIGVLLSVVYSLLLFSRIMFGTLNSYYRLLVSHTFFLDLKLFEQYILIFFLIMVCVFGLSTTSLTSFMTHTLSFIINYY